MRLRAGLLALLATAVLWTQGPVVAQGSTTAELAAKLKVALKLNDDQVAKIKPLLDQEHAADLQREATMVGRVRPILTADQQKLLDGLRAKQLQPQPGGKFRFIDFRGDLHLNPQQAVQVKNWRNQDRPTVKAERDKVAAQIEAVLTPAQKTQYEALRHHRKSTAAPTPATPVVKGGTPAPAPSSDDNQ